MTGAGRLPAACRVAVAAGGRSGELVVLTAGEGEVVVRDVVRAGGDTAGLAGPGLTGKSAGAERATVVLGRAQVVEPACLFPRDLLGNNRLLGTASTPEAPAALTALPLVRARVVVGPIGTPPCHRCSSPALSPLSSSFSMPAARLALSAGPVPAFPPESSTLCATAS